MNLAGGAQKFSLQQCGGVCVLVGAVAKSCLTLRNPMGYNPSDSSVQGFSKQGYWSGLPFPSPGDLPNAGTEPTFPGFPASADGFFTTEPCGKHITL